MFLKTRSKVHATAHRIVENRRDKSFRVGYSMLSDTSDIN